MTPSIEPATGPQTVTQNPQNIPSQNLSAAAGSSGIQPGTATDLLNSGTQGQSLGAPNLATVSLVDTAPRTARAQTFASSTAKPSTHHVNGVLFIIPVVLVLAAIAMFWAMTRASAKSTTD